jgi:hypothetical protein
MSYIPASAMSSASIKTPPIRLGILGVPGVGKTWAALTFPNPIVLDLDNKLSGYVKAHPDHAFPIIPFWNRDYVVNVLKVNNFKSGLGATVYTQNDKYPHNIRDAVTRWLVEEGPKLESEQTLILDSFTTLNDGYDIQSNQSWEQSYNKSGEVDGFFFWKMKLHYNTDINSKLRALKCNVVAIFHELPERDENGRQIGIKPLIQGSSADKVPKDYTDFYRQVVVTRDQDISKFKGLSWADDKETEIYAWQRCKDKYVQITCSSMPNSTPFVRANYQGVFGV